MRIKPFGKNIQPACKYCVHITRKKDKYICDRKNNTVSGGNKCLWYKYDPLARIPAPAPELPKYDKKDFTL